MINCKLHRLLLYTAECLALPDLMSVALGKTRRFQIDQVVQGGHVCLSSHSRDITRHYTLHRVHYTIFCNKTMSKLAFISCFISPQSKSSRLQSKSLCQSMTATQSFSLSFSNHYLFMQLLPNQSIWSGRWV